MTNLNTLCELNQQIVPYCSYANHSSRRGHPSISNYKEPQTQLSLIFLLDKWEEEKKIEVKNQRAYS